MGKPNDYYYSVIKKWILVKDELPDNRLQTAIFNNAFNDAIEETKKLPNGDLRLKAIDEVLIRKTKTYVGVAQDINYDWRTVQNWITSFIKLVGRKAGF